MLSLFCVTLFHMRFTTGVFVNEHRMGDVSLMTSIAPLAEVFYGLKVCLQKGKEQGTFYLSIQSPL